MDGGEGRSEVPEGAGSVVDRARPAALHVPLTFLPNVAGGSGMDHATVRASPVAYRDS
jgi:hypothetical protein